MLRIMLGFLYVNIGLYFGISWEMAYLAILYAVYEAVIS